MGNEVTRLYCQVKKCKKEISIPDFIIRYPSNHDKLKDYKYCSNHKCKIIDCNNQKYNNFYYCKYHICATLNCNDKAKSAGYCSKCITILQDKYDNIKY
jgi:hypothetical protein